MAAYSMPNAYASRMMPRTDPRQALPMGGGQMQPQAPIAQAPQQPTFGAPQSPAQPVGLPINGMPRISPPMGGGAPAPGAPAPPMWGGQPPQAVNQIQMQPQPGQMPQQQVPNVMAQRFMPRPNGAS